MAKELGLRCAITSLATQSAASTPLDETRVRRMRLAAQVRRWAVDGVEYMQLREKRLHAGELFDLATAAMVVLRELQDTRTRLLINGRADVAAAAGAHGVHLTGREGELRPEQVRTVFRAAGRSTCLISVSCHTLAEVEAARDRGADLLLVGPVFEKSIGGHAVMEGIGLERLRHACDAAGSIPVFALGGVTERNAADCRQAGAAGVAGIRLFEVAEGQ